MLDSLDRNDQLGLAAVAVVLVVVGFGAGFAVAGAGSLPGDGTESNQSKAAAQQAVQSFIDGQVATQRQRQRQIANRSQNISADDLSLDATVGPARDSAIEGLYTINVSTTGTTLGRFGRLQEIDQTREYYVSKNGRYLFVEPVDLQNTTTTPAL